MKFIFSKFMFLKTYYTQLLYKCNLIFLSINIFNSINFSSFATKHSKFQTKIILKNRKKIKRQKQKC